MTMPEQSEPVSVLVTGVGGGGHGMQILKALREAKTEYEVVGTDLSPYSYGLELVEHPYLVPPANSEEYIPTLLRLCEKHGVKAIFHGSEPELRVIGQNRSTFETRGILVPINPMELVDACMDKLATMEKLEQLGYKVPSYQLIQTVEDLESFHALPAILKPHVGGGGSAHVHLVQDRKSLESIGAYLLDTVGPFIAQAYVGDPESEYTVGVLHDMEGNFLNSIAVRRYILSALGNRTKVRNTSGKESLGGRLAVSSGVSQGDIGKFPEVTKTCEAIANSIGAKGPLNIQCRLVDGEVVVFEINPRFSGTTSLRALVGYNEPDILVRQHVFGEKVEPGFSYQEGVILRALSERLMDTLEYPKA